MHDVFGPEAAAGVAQDGRSAARGTSRGRETGVTRGRRRAHSGRGARRAPRGRSPERAPARGRVGPQAGEATGGAVENGRTKSAHAAT